ncbi:C4-dicarboxylate ABC transporter [Curvibacter sp. PAE-UM]|nr:C4-dicarboxylate ABC transporter [Curvibacter sp. PAE-UM]
MQERFHALNDVLYLACLWVAGIAITVMSLIIPWGIFTRYVLGTGSQWPEPVSILLMVVFTFLGAAVSYRAGAHIAVAMVTDRLPQSLKRPLAGFVHLMMLSVALFMLYYGTRLCLATWGQNIGELPFIPVGLTYTPVPIGGLITALFVIEHISCGSQAERAIVTYDREGNT